MNLEQTRSVFTLTRDVLILLTGLGLIIYEAVVYRGPERYSLIVLYAGMVGLPVVLRIDEKRSPEPPSEEGGNVQTP